MEDVACILEEKVYHRDILLLTGGFYGRYLDKLTEIENAASAIVRHADDSQGTGLLAVVS